MTTQLIRGLYNLTGPQPGSVVTIGNFDGVHRGHQALLKQVEAEAKQRGLESVVVTFEPQPAEFFTQGKSSIPRLTRWREKFLGLKRCEIDKVVVLRFDRLLAKLSPEQFVEKILVAGLNTKHVVIGDDFRFGKDRVGDFAYLEKLGRQHGFTVAAMKSVLLDNERISSTRIRKALRENDHELVSELLGQAYSMKGRVVHGHKRGRSIGFPTANIYLQRHVTPVQGVYIVRMHGLDDRVLPGVANIGIRPTVGGTRNLLEVHLFNFNEDIYGRHVCVEFCEKIRDEKRFDSLELLKIEIIKDADIARDYFKKEGSL